MQHPFKDSVSSGHDSIYQFDRNQNKLKFSNHKFVDGEFNDLPFALLKLNVLLNL